MENRSKNINPILECRYCGKCCKWFSVGYKKTMLKSNFEDRLCFSEIHRYLDLKTDKIFVIEYPDVFCVVFDIPCKYLKIINRKYTCEIYGENRPLVCEYYPYKKKDCEKYVKPINVFKDSKSFLKRIKETQEVSSHSSHQ